MKENGKCVVSRSKNSFHWAIGDQLSAITVTTVFLPSGEYESMLKQLDGRLENFQ